MNANEQLVKINNAYARKVFSACYDYLMELRETDPKIKRIHMISFTSAAADETITYSIGPAACEGLTFGEDGVMFNARFSGKVESVFVPWSWVCVIMSPELQSPFAPNLHDPYGILTPFSGYNYFGDEAKVDKEPTEAEKLIQERRSKLRLI